MITCKFISLGGVAFLAKTVFSFIVFLLNIYLALMLLSFRLVDRQRSKEELKEMDEHDKIKNETVCILL